jgi:two-component system, NarL family, nitrate/nitrite response regulator NarL
VIQTFLVSDRFVYKDALVAAFENDGRVRVVGMGSSGDAFRASRDGGPYPSVVLIQLGPPEGVAAAHHAREIFENMPVVIFDLCETRKDIEPWIGVSAEGWLGRSSSFEELVDAIECVSQGGVFCTPSIAVAFLQSGAQSDVGSRNPLTVREREVAKLVAEGRTNMQIANLLEIRVATVKNHVHNALQKVGLRDRQGLARWFLFREG